MSSEADLKAQKYREFMGLLPLTLAIAGLPDAEPGRYFNEGQLEARTGAIKNAYKMARQLIIEITAVRLAAPQEQASSAE
jgi:hypothetical protein